ncbi:ATP-binding protein [Streptomyces albireticuli]|nr:ATP-binding protein [Streptomyces albireticuli]
MDPTNRSDEFDDRGPESADSGSERPAAAHDTPGAGAGPVRVVQLVAAEYVLTVNPVDGSEIEPCLPGRRPDRPGRRGPADRAELDRASVPPAPARQVGPELPLLDRQEERERLSRLLSRGRSVRLTGPSGSGRTKLLDAVAADCADLAPDGVVRLSGHHRTTSDLLYELYAAVHDAPRYRPDRAELLTAVHEIGAVVVLDDLEFGGAALDELLDATPECAFLLAATPEVAAPSADSHLEEVFLGGLDRTGCLELLEHAVDRPLTDEEADWAADLWFASEGLPLRFVQAGALLRQRDEMAADPAVDEFGVFAERPYVAAEAEAAPGPEGVPLPALAEVTAPVPLLASRLGDAARTTLEFAVALGGEVPHQAHLPALVGDTHADAAVGELLASGLITATGSHYRLAAGVTEALLAEGYGAEAADRAHSAAQHYSWWAGHPSVAPERAAAEADAILATMAVLAADGTAGHPAAAVLLARTAAPAFAAALHWSAWERSLRHGQEAARHSGEVGEEAYFHHELGVLALCTGNLDRARAELEASVGMRGVLADKRGAIAGRRALALVADRSGLSMGAAAVPMAVPRNEPGRPGPVPPGLTKAPAGPPVPPREPAPGRTPAGEEVPAARSEESATPPSALVPPGRDAGSTTAVTRIVGAGAAPFAGQGGTFGQSGAPGAPGQGGAFGKGGAAAPAGAAPRQPWARKLMVAGARRNLAAAGAGTLLAAVLGTVVTLGITSGGQDGDSSDSGVKPDRSASQQDGDNPMNADQPAQGGPGHAQVPGKHGKPGQSGGPDASGSPSPGASGSASPSGSPSGSGEPSPSSSSSSSGRPSHSPSQSPGGGSSKPSEKPSPSQSGGGQSPSHSPEPEPSSPSQPASGGGSSAASQSAAGQPSGGRPADGSGGGEPSSGTPVA